MAQGVAEVQEHPNAGVVLVFLHHLALDVAAAEGDVFNVGHDALSIPERPETVKQSPVPDASVFNDLRHTVREDSIRQGFQATGSIITSFG